MHTLFEWIFMKEVEIYLGERKLQFYWRNATEWISIEKSNFRNMQMEEHQSLHSNHYCNTVHVRYSTSIYSFCLSKLVIISMLSQWLASSPVCSAVMGLLLLPVVASINGRSWISLAQHSSGLSSRVWDLLITAAATAPGHEDHHHHDEGDAGWHLCFFAPHLSCSTFNLTHDCL